MPGTFGPVLAKQRGAVAPCSKHWDQYHHWELKCFIGAESYNIYKNSLAKKGSLVVRFLGGVKNCGVEKFKSEGGPS
jgi:hypothetical protein